VPPRVDDAVDPAAWLAGFEELFAEVVAPYFFRREPRLRARSYMLGLVSGLERKDGRWPNSRGKPRRMGCSGC
jgi:hypothetical protein